MITISRALAQRVRTVFRRAFGSSQRIPIWLRFAASVNGLRVQAIHDQVAIEFRLAGPIEPDELLVPLDLLAACEGKNCQDPVRLRKLDGGQVLAEWLDKQIPQQRTGEKPPQKLVEFPQAPIETVSNTADLLPALAAACNTTDSHSSRYALGCINLRGQSGSIAATDGHQLLVQRGWQFPWQTDVLVPGNRVFSSPELAIDQPVQVGQAGDWVMLSAGPWSVFLRVQKDARFPQIDDMVRSPTTAKSRLTLSPADARFAADAIKRLPIGDDGSEAVTLDLNGEVLLRARAKVGTPATELHLINSQLTGESVRLVSGRKFLGRALDLGFTDISLWGPEGALQANDDRRNYIWMPWSEESFVPADVDTRRITSTLGGTVPAKRTSRTTTQAAETVSAAAVEQLAQPQDSMPETEVKPKNNTSPIEQVSELRNVLHEALTRTNEVLRSLKRQRKQSRLVETTLQSLKQLQQVA